MKSSGNISTANRAFVLSSSSHSRSRKLIYTAPMTVVPLAWVSLLHRSGNLFLTNHTNQLLLVHQPMNPGHPLVCGDCRKSLQSLEVLVRHDNWLFILLDGNSLLFDGLDCIHYTVRDYSVQNIYKVLFVREALVVTVREVVLDLCPFLTTLAA